MVKPGAVVRQNGVNAVNSSGRDICVEGGRAQGAWDKPTNVIHTLPALVVDEAGKWSGHRLCANTVQAREYEQSPNLLDDS
jgi:hypothetical protein